MNNSASTINRRIFLQGSLALPLVSGLFASAAESTAPSSIRNYQPGMKYRQVGNSGLYFSILSLGGYASDEAVIEYATDHGVNLMHTCLTYRNGQDSATLGKFLKNHRDKLYIAVKDEYDQLDDVLRALQTDHIDFLMFNRHNRSAASEPKILDKIEMYKRHGKIRFGGLTTHGDVQKSTQAGINSGLFTVVMPALNKPNFDEMSDELQLAHEKGVGVIAMKVIMGIEDPALQKAQIKKALQHPGVTTYMKGIHSFEEFDTFYEATQESVTRAEEHSLRQFASANRSNLCRMCDECKRHCPQGFEISTVIRCHDYYDNQLKDPERALAEYRAIPLDKRWNDRCSQCKQCEGACPSGIQIVQRLQSAHQRFGEIA